jgi:hypothetical protein
MNKQHKLEQAIVKILNLDGWKLKWTGEGSESWDAEGLTPKGKECVIEMKFRNKYYPTKMLRKVQIRQVNEYWQSSFLFCKRPESKLYVLA